MFKNSKTFFIYLFSYLSLLILSSCFFIFFIQGYPISMLTDEILHSYSMVSDQIVQNLDSQIENLYQIDYQLTNKNSNLSSYLLLNNSAIKEQKITNELSNCISTNKFISEVALYPHNSTSVYTSNGISDASFFFTKRYNFPNWSYPEQMISQIKKRTIILTHNPTNSKQYLTFINPPSTFSNLPTSSLVFFIPIEEIRQLLAPTQNSSAISLIFDAKNKISISGTQLMDDEMLFFQNLILEAQNTSIEGPSYASNYVYFINQSDYSPLTYASFFPESTSFETIALVQQKGIIFMVICVLIGGILIIYYMKITYFPLKNLSAHSRTLLNNISNKDDITTLQDTIDYLTTENITLTHTVNDPNLIQSMYNSIVFSLLKGHFSNRASFNQAGQYLHLSLSKKYYAVLLIHSLHSNQPSDVDLLKKILESTITTDYEYYFRELFGTEQYVLVLGVDHLDNDTVYSLLQQILDYSQSNYTLSFTIAVGNFYEEIHKIPTSYFEASMASREFFISDSIPIIFFKQVNQNIKSLAYPSKTIGNFTIELKSSNIEGAQASLNKLIESIKGGSIPSIMAKNICQNVTYLILSKLNTLPNISKTVDILVLDYLDSITSYEEYLYKLMDTLNECITSIPKTQEDLPLLDRIINFIHAHYDNCNFSIQEMANILNVNSSYMSIYFKNQTQTTILDYTSNLRIQKAKHLLSISDLPLNLIAEEVGYYNTNSFIRRFKQICNITPGEFRKSILSENTGN